MSELAQFTHLIGDSHPVQTPFRRHIVDRQTLLVLRVDLHLVRRRQLEQRDERQGQRQSKEGVHVGEVERAVRWSKVWWALFVKKLPLNER
jgi:hypothetical protein